jgi:PqqA peptide cyclase
MDRPFGLVAELTYRCPLACAYCSNPINLSDYNDELSTAQWQDVLKQARDLGVLQCHLSGGEPLLRRDIVDIAATSSELGLYTNLITSAIGLSRKKARELREAGLDHIQISVQADEAVLSDAIAGIPSFERKIEAAQVVKELGWPLTLNVVLHRRNIDRIEAIVRAAERLGADRLELANTQYYGWGLRNRDTLLPSREQLARAEQDVRAARTRLAKDMEILYVLPDYYNEYPKPCMGGWGSRQLILTPNGGVLPCLAAHSLGIPVPSVTEEPLAEIWTGSELFRAYRGTEWMPSLCRNCERRDIDFGGCRCQAFQLTGDASRADPVCHLSPDHGIVEDVLRAVNDESRPDAPALRLRPHR